MRGYDVQAATETLASQGLVAGSFPVMTKKVTIASGAAILLAGSVLGQVVAGSAVAAMAGGNTGTGTFGSVVVSAGHVPGVYTLDFVEAATDAGQFEVKNPAGQVVGVGNVGVAFSGGGLAFTISDGTDFVVGDHATITVAAGSGDYTIAKSAAVDGSQAPVAILVDDADPTGGAVEAMIYETGEFLAAALIWGTGLADTDATRAALRANSIFLRDGISSDFV